MRLRKKIEPLYRFIITGGPDDPTYIEGNRVYAVDIGNFPLESNKGAYVEFFTKKNRPQNMMINHDFIFDKAMDALEHPTKHEPVFITHTGQRYEHLDNMIKTGEEIVGIEKWRNHPSVVAKRAAGTLSRDPS